ncbi:MAG: ArsR/SmtB family transcription factor [Phycisphaerales bacterium]
MSRPFRTRDDERDVFRALAHSVRRKIIAASLEQTQSFEQLRERVHRTDSALAGHLRILREAGLLVVTRDGRSVHYRVNQRVLRSGANWLMEAAHTSVPPAA